MNNFIAKCGCNCKRCLTYKSNLKTSEDRNRCSWGWQKYLKIKLSPEKLRFCDGCSIPDETRKVYYLNCLVRKCAIMNGFENCAYCSGYPCQEVLTIHSLQKPDAIEKNAGHLGAVIPEQDYLTFIELNKGIKHLDEIRQTLEAEKIIEMKMFSFHPPIMPFPHELPFSKDENFALQNLHQTLSSLEKADHVSFARRINLEKNRIQILIILWAFGKFGELNETAGTYLILDSETYSNQKISSYYSKVQYYFRKFEKYSILCQLVPLQEKGWITPTGGLRKTGWLMKLSFDKKIGGLLILKGL